MFHETPGGPGDRVTRLCRVAARRKFSSSQLCLFRTESAHRAGSRRAYVAYKEYSAGSEREVARYAIGHKMAERPLVGSVVPLHHSRLRRAPSRRQPTKALRMPTRGYRKGVSDTKEPRPHLIRTRTTTSVFRKFSEEAGARNVTLSTLVRLLLEAHVAGRCADLPHPRGLTTRAVRALDRLGNNLNQIGRQANLDAPAHARTGSARRAHGRSCRRRSSHPWMIPVIEPTRNDFIALASYLVHGKERPTSTGSGGMAFRLTTSRPTIPCAPPKSWPRQPNCPDAARSRPTTSPSTGIPTNAPPPR